MTLNSTVTVARSIIVRKDYTDTELTTGKAVLIVFMSVMNVFMFLGNTLSIVTICSSRRLRQQVSYWFVLNLAIIDLLISVTVVPLNTMWEYYGVWPLSKASCQILTFADMSFSTISAYSIVMVSIDKYIYVTYAIQYYHRMTRKTAVIMMVSVWMFVTAFSTWWLVSDLGTEDNFKDHFLELPDGTETCVYILTDTYIIPSVIVAFFLPLLVLCFTSSRIICIASRHLRTIHAFEKSSPSVTYSDKYSATKPQINTISATVQNHSCQKQEIPELTVNTDCPETETEKQETSFRIKEETKDQERYDEIREANAVDKTEQPSEPVIEEVTQSNNENRFKHYIIKLWTKFSHMKSKNRCSVELNIDSKGEDIACSQSVAPSSSSQPTTVTDTSSTLTVPHPVHKTFSLKSITSRDILAKRRSTLSGRPIRPYCKLFGTVTIVIACFVIMFAPFNIAVIVDVTCHCIEPWLYEDVLSVMYYMHSLVNPCIYMSTDRKYKAALKLLWKRFKKNFSRQTIG